MVCVQIMVDKAVGDQVGGLRQLTPTSTCVLIEGVLAETPEGTKQKVGGRLALAHYNCAAPMQCCDAWGLLKTRLVLACGLGCCLLPLPLLVAACCSLECSSAMLPLHMPPARILAARPALARAPI